MKKTIIDVSPDKTIKAASFSIHKINNVVVLYFYLIKNTEIVVK